MAERMRVEEPARLLDFLAARLEGWHRNTLRQRLRAGCVLVNGGPVSRADHALAAGDAVEVVALEEGTAPLRAPAGIAVLHADEDLVAIDKPAGLLSVSTARQRERTALALVRESLARPGRPARLWPVHRLDRETSGVLLFARSREACESVQERWGDARKTYLAVVEGHPRPPSGVVAEPLREDRALNVRVARGPDAKPARTRYATLETAAGRALLEVELETGRRHQVRAHLAFLGHPVVGDRRYGAGAARMGLHALRLSLPHPRDGRQLVLEAAAPPALRALLRG